jgi:hypothetical protein
MNLKQLAIVSIAAMSALACNQPSTTNSSTTDTAAKTVTIGTPLSAEQTKEETAFLTDLFTKQDLKPAIKKSRLLKKEKVMLYGGTKPYTLAYIDYNDGSTVLRPYMALYILDDKGTIVGDYTVEKAEQVVVFDGKDPMLMVMEQTGAEHGEQHLIGIVNGKVKDFLDQKDWALLTTDAESYTPKFLPYEVKSIKGQKEIIFSGKYNNKPFALTFTWNSQMNMFEAKK